MGEVQTLDQFREWIRNQCRKDVDPQYGDNMVADFEKIVRADTIPRAQVQAAVDEINMEMEGPEDEWPIRILNYHTGLLPTECE